MKKLTLTLDLAFVVDVAFIRKTDLADYGEFRLRMTIAFRK